MFAMLSTAHEGDTVPCTELKQAGVEVRSWSAKVPIWDAEGQGT